MINFTKTKINTQPQKNTPSRWGGIAKKILLVAWNPNMILLTTGFVFIVLAKLKLYQELLQYLFERIPPSRSALFLYPGNVGEITYLLSSDLLFVVTLGLAYICTKRILGGAKTVEAIFLLINGAYCIVAFCNKQWVADNGMILDYGTLLFALNQFGDAWTVVRSYATAQMLLVVIAFVLFGGGYYAWRRKIVLPAPLSNRKKWLLMGMFCLSVTGLLSYDATKTNSAEKMHSQVVRNTKSIHFEFLKAALAEPFSEALADQGMVMQMTDLEQPTATPNIILLGLESVRFRSTPFAQAEGIDNFAAMPFLQSLAKDGALVMDARTPLPRTSKSLATVLTGRTPVIGSYLGETELNYPMHGLPYYLKKYGYRSAYFQSPLGYFERRPALMRNMGFDTFVTGQEIDPTAELIGYLNIDDRTIIDPAITWAKADKTPFVLTMFTSITHHPYMLPGQYDPEQWEKFKTTMSANEKYDLYKKSLAFTDEYLHQTLEKLEKNGLLENSIVVIFGDHGEGFGDKGIFAHSQNPYESVLRVPLVIYGKDYIQPQVIEDGRYSSMDIVPTLFKLMGVKNLPPEIDGVDIFANTSPQRKLFFSTWYDTSVAGVVDEDGKKFIFDPQNNMMEVYDLDNDPWEKINLYASLKADGFDFEPIKDEIIQWKVDHYHLGYDQDKSEVQDIFNWRCEATGNGRCFLQEPQ